MLRPAPCDYRTGSLFQIDILSGCVGRRSRKARHLSAWPESPSKSPLCDGADATPVLAWIPDVKATSGPLAAALFKQDSREVSQAVARERLMAVLPETAAVPESPQSQQGSDDSGDAWESNLSANEFFNHLTSEECLADSDVWKAARSYCRRRALQDFPPARLWPELPLPDASALFLMSSKLAAQDASPRKPAGLESTVDVDSWSDMLNNALEIHVMTLLPSSWS